MSDDRQRADFSKIHPSPAPIGLFGPGTQTFQRILQTLGGAADASSVSAAIESVLRGSVPMLDATQAPFRINGQRFSLTSEVAALAANNTLIDLQNATDRQPNNGVSLVVVDELRYQGPSFVRCKVAFRTGATVSAPVAPNLEARGGNGGDFATKPFVQSVAYLVTQQAGDVAGWNVIAPFATLANVAAGSPSDIYRPDGLVLWPGEVLHLFQVTVNVALLLTISGRVWTFLQAPAAS